jgi:hypothetical protein
MLCSGTFCWGLGRSFITETADRRRAAFVHVFQSYLQVQVSIAGEEIFRRPLRERALYTE